MSTTSTPTPTTNNLRDALNFFDNSPSPFHAVEEARQRLVKSGFVEIKETENWDIKPLGKYFLTRNQSTLYAFAVGGQYKPGNAFTIIGAHTDSPCLRVKARSKIEAHGYLQIGVETYGGGLWHTWFDRDLTLAGRVILQEKDGSSYSHKLVNLEKPILRIPTLAIHLHRSDEFAPNKERHLVPILASAIQGKLELETSNDESFKHHPLLLNLLSKQLSCNVSQIRDFELCVADTQKAAVGGGLDEFIFSPRLDNLGSSYCAVKSLIDSCEGDGLGKETGIRLITLFDHEEVGSNSAQGAQSLMLESTLRRICQNSQDPVAFEKAMARSFLISADQAHGIHPNYADKHEERHKPGINQGIVIKINSNQKYATNAVTSFIFKEAARRAQVPVQDVMVRNDSLCGSTIGPIVASGLGMRTIDVGMAQLSMHSIREMAGVYDIDYAVNLFKTFFLEFSDIDKNLKVD